MVGDGIAAPQPAWTGFQLAMAARLTWPEAVASHLTAAGLHHFPLEDERAAHVIAGRGQKSRRGLKLHVLQLDTADTICLPSGITVTTPRRTAFDCLSALPFERGLDLWAWLSSRRVLDHDDLLQAVGDRRGWTGTPRLARLARVTKDGAVSEAEYRLHKLLRRAGLRGWQAGVAVRDDNGVIGVVDVLFAGQRVIVEVDGWRAHSSPSAFVADRRRQNRLVAAGYIVLRVTWDDLCTRPDAVIREIRATLSRGWN